MECLYFDRRGDRYAGQATFIYDSLGYILSASNMPANVTAKSLDCLYLFITLFEEFISDRPTVNKLCEIVLQYSESETACSILKGLCCHQQFYFWIEDDRMRAVFAFLKRGLHSSAIRCAAADFWAAMAHREKGLAHSRNFTLGAIPLIGDDLLSNHDDQDFKEAAARCLVAFADAEPLAVFPNLAGTFRERVSAELPETQESAFWVLRVIARVSWPELVRPFLKECLIFDILRLAPERTQSSERPRSLPPPGSAPELFESISSAYSALLRNSSDFFFLLKPSLKLCGSINTRNCRFSRSVWHSCGKLLEKLRLAVILGQRSNFWRVFL
jgi:hypothetical protein